MNKKKNKKKSKKKSKAGKQAWAKRTPAQKKKQLKVLAKARKTRLAMQKEQKETDNKIKRMYTKRKPVTGKAIFTLGNFKMECDMSIQEAKKKFA